jgi:hypothetical protein
VFSTATNAGLKLSFPGEAPSSIKFGFNREELSIIPLHHQTTADKPDIYTPHSPDEAAFLSALAVILG